MRGPCGTLERRIPIARSIRKTCIAIGLRCIETLLTVGRTLAHFGALLGTAIAAVGHRLAVGIIPLYRAWWVFRRTTAHARLLGEQRLVGVLASRMTVHALFTVAVLGLAAQTIHANERGGFIGERPLLSAFVSSEFEETEEEVLGPATTPLRSTFRTASVSRAFEPVVLSAEASAMPAIPTAGSAIMQPIITDAAVADTGRAGVFAYTVEEGDVLSTIAEKFGISTSTILWENKLTAYSVIRPGDQLRVLPTDGVTHVVKNGDTLESIAKRYAADAEEVLEFNHLIDADDLTIGDVLIVPGGRPPTVIAPPTVIRRPVTQPARPLPSIAGKYLWPSVAGYRISQYYTWRHHGLDIAVSHGTPVFASDAGVVVYSGWMSGYGYQVTIDHGNGLRTRYAHNSRLLVSRGEQVSRGQTISLVGSTGRSTGPHIHYEVFAHGVRVNPLTYLR